MKTIISPIQRALLVKEISSLPKDNCYIERGKFQVYIVQAHNTPNLLREIGRLSEQTFREVGEGTGNALDVDEYDQYYFNLFIWDTEASQIVGGYRVGKVTIYSSNLASMDFILIACFTLSRLLLQS